MNHEQVNEISYKLQAKPCPGWVRRGHKLSATADRAWCAGVRAMARAVKQEKVKK